MVCTILTQLICKYRSVFLLFLSCNTNLHKATGHMVVIVMISRIQMVERDFKVLDFISWRQYSRHGFLLINNLYI